MLLIIIYIVIFNPQSIEALIGASCVTNTDRTRKRREGGAIQFADIN